MDRWAEILLTVVAAVFGSSGLWAWLQKRHDKKDAKTLMLIGLGHDRIMILGEKYLSRGWISANEYEDLVRYLYEPYKKLGGNGTAEKLMADIRKLPIRKPEQNEQINMAE